MLDPKNFYGDQNRSLLSLAVIASVGVAVISMIMATIAGVDLLMALTTYVVMGGTTLLFVVCIPLLVLAASKVAKLWPWTHESSDAQSYGPVISSIKSEKWCCDESCYRCNTMQGRHYRKSVM